MTGAHHRGRPAPELPARPRMVFFQWDHEPNRQAAGFLALHMRQHVKCLEQVFDVTVVARDCDYAEVCDAVEPDLALFESGYRTHGSKRIAIRNTGAHPNVPKVGLHNGDPWCDRRAGFVSDMEAWGVEAFFSISTTMHATTPQLSDRLYIWPNFIDPEIFRDHGLPKVVPVTLIGQSYGLYPWRQRVFPLARENFACLTSPTPMYERPEASRMPSGADYARLLNASRLVPACGAAGGEVVRKHFEIPGSMSCLVTERTPAVEAAGFRDMETCVFADGDDFVEKVDHLLSHEDELARITAAGHDLVHARHTIRHRPQILQWYALRRTLAPGERIVQDGPFGDLEAVPAQAAMGRVAAASGPDRRHVAEGRARLERGDTESARRHFAATLEHVPYLPEARFGLALCDLEEGRPRRAGEALAASIEVSVTEYGAADPDPLEWSLYVVCLICQDRLGDARACLGWYPSLAHRELAFAARALGALAGGGVPATRAAADRPSLHHLPPRDYEAWRVWLRGLLLRSGQEALARRLDPAAAGDGAPAGAGARGRASLGRLVDSALGGLGLGALRPGVPPLPEFRYRSHLTRLLGRRVLRSRLGGPAAALRGALAPRRGTGRG